MTLKAFTLPLALFCACSSSDQAGTLEVSVYGEAFIEEGIPADEFVDGWSLEFDSFDVNISDIRAGQAGGDPEITMSQASSYDLVTATAGAGQLVVAGEVDGGTYDAIAFRIDSMSVTGSATMGAVTKTFAWSFDTPTLYEGCAGTAVVDGDSARTLLTVHGDHLFFDDLVSDSPNVAFELIAQADDQGDNDGVVSAAELMAIDITGEARYQVGNQTDIVNLWQFIDAQASLVGHIDGEGHCDTAQRL